MKKTARKVLLMACSALLLVCLTVGATVAYLTSTTDVVTNTFTVGKIKITLDEAKVDLYGVPVTGAARVIKNDYKLVPGHEYTKDPTIHIDATSEESYLFVKVENQIADLEATGDTTIAKQMEAKGWVPLTGVANVYYYNKTVVGGTDTDVVVFDKFILADNAPVDATTTTGEGENAVTTYNWEGKTVKITAYAVQADGIKDTEAEHSVNAAAAWAAAPAKW